MNAYLLSSDLRLTPFGDHPRDAFIAGQTLAAHQAAALHQLGLQLVPVPPGTPVHDPAEHLLVDDCLYFTPELPQEFISRSRALRRPTWCALTPGLTTLRACVATQGVPITPERVDYALHYVPPDGGREAPQPVVIAPDRFVRTVPMPRHMFGSDGYPLPLSERLLIRIAHWTNLLAANQLTLFARGARLQLLPKRHLLRLVLRARSVNPWRVLRTLNLVGHGCDIHPTAYVEGSTIGDQVTIGAHSVVRGSVVGSGSYIGNGAILEVAAVGEGCNIMNGCMVQGAVLYPGSFTMARLISASVCGRDSFVGDGVTLTDFRFDGRSIAVQQEGRLVETGNGVVGSCLGHGVYLGAGSVVAPGRSVPNGLRLAPEGGRVLRSWPRMGAPAGYQVIGGSSRADQTAAASADD
jgi:carbonic anhydrase/acetyltransferase-like protein (isoleucine patch superfamily)